MAKCKVKENVKPHKRCPQGSATGKKTKAGNPVCAGGQKPEQIQMYERCPPNEAKPKKASKKTSSKKAPSASAPRKPASKKASKKAASGFTTLGSQLKSRMRAYRREESRPRKQDVMVDLPGFGPTSMGMDYSPEVLREMELYSNL